MSRWPRILFWLVRLQYLQAVHRRIVAAAPAHPEASATWLEIQHARRCFTAARRTQ